MDEVDGVAAEVGRSPSTLHHTVSVLVEAPGSVGNVERSKRWDDPPAITGDQQEIAASLERFADIGVDEVQLVVDPITDASVEWLSGVVDRMKA